MKYKPEVQKEKKYTGKWNKRPKYHNIMEGMSANMIKIENLVKRYGNLVALDHLDLEIAKGEIFGLLGPNGCGKTTAIGCILALLRYDKGEITICGEKMTPESYELKRKIGIVPQEVAIFDQLTVQENIDYFCGLYLPDRKKRKEYVEDAITFVGLNDYKKMYPKQLSGGLLRRLNIACGIAHKPEIIFMDEPTVAVDPQSRNHIIRRNPQIKSDRSNDHLHFTLYGRSRADLHTDCHFRSWTMHRKRNQRRVKTNDPNRRKDYCRRSCPKRSAA